MEITPAVKEDFLIFEDDVMLSTMFGKLKQFEKRSGLVFRKNKYHGLIEKKKLLKTKIDVTKSKIASFTQKTPILSAHADIIETAYLMFQSNFDFLPVEREKEIYGVINALDLLNLACDLPELGGLKVADIKLSKPKTVNKNDPVSTAIDIMYKDRVDQVPVFDKGKLYGVISYRDIMGKYFNWSPKREVSAKFNTTLKSKSAQVDTNDMANLPVSSFSTNDNLLATKKEITLANAIKLMLKNNVSDLIVVGSSGVEGLLTLKNILRRVASLKIPQNFNIKFVGLSKMKLKPYQKNNLKKIASNESFKLQRELKNEFSLIIHLKDYSKEGNQHKYSINLRIDFPGHIITSTQADWNLETALRKTFDNAKNELNSKFRRR